MSQEDLLMIDDDEEDNIEEMFLTFEVGEEEYGVGIINVTEIVRLQKIIEVPDVPHYVRGVINLRGKVIPVIDVRKRFSLPDTEYSNRTTIIVLDVEEVPTGLIVDRVNEVIEIPEDRIDAPPRKQKGEDGVIQGMGKHGDRVCIILDIDHLLSDEQLAFDLERIKHSTKEEAA
ncbi:MAG: chemotaxis protein CheW [Gammaproteobacteria bacterium]|jgi:purine-binding chemotaxis protein CheW|nr:chemotaxis protein CheW [Gammaproteobacteria bacterium]MBT4607633.1 chemotaxis protein CheW [Thiotrichales bacterium]MBT3967697.1 chemotaxis protein CheW [Gammaproteobacteria bacterium]MBT4079847.1 chemotaxis protein CheW [Gammaproteobacteria bacterium]MBT4330728.1 chemotaxis protein CheW [Gammaproteobacteria bacterium]